MENNSMYVNVVRYRILRNTDYFTDAGEYDKTGLYIHNGEGISQSGVHNGRLLDENMNLVENYVIRSLDVNMLDKFVLVK